MSVQYSICGNSSSGIVSDVENAVQDGLLLPGERLPSVRRLAAQLGISPGTVQAAYAELRRRGVVVTYQGGATRVSDRPPLGAPLPAIMVRPGTRDLATGNPDPALLPDLGAALIRVAQAMTSSRLYNAEPNIPELLALVRAELPGATESDGSVVSGALDGIDRALAAAVRPGSLIAIEDPGYDSLLGLVRARGHAPVPMNIDQHGPSPDGMRQALAAGASAVVITCRGQNPTGAALTAERVHELSEVLTDFPHALMIENDHLGAVAGVPLVSLSGCTERWVHVRSFAKPLGPDLRVAAVVGDERTVGRIRGQQALGPGWVSELLQRTVLELLGDLATRALLQRAADTYATRRNALIAALADVGIPATGTSGFNVWVPVPHETVAVTGLLDAGWATAPGSRYQEQAGAPGIRITTSSLAPDEAIAVAHALHIITRGSTRRTA